MPNATDLVQLLENRVARDGSRPLLTCYDLDDESRVEFSARTFANWVDKTCNLLGELGVDEGARITLPVALTAPGHWVSLVWTMACWQYGSTATVVPVEQAGAADVVVLAPDATQQVPGAETVVCSLHPLGLGLPNPVEGTTDYAEALSQPDLHWRSSLRPEVVFATAERELDAAGLCDVAPSEPRWVVPIGQSADPLQVLQQTLVTALVHEGSVVIVRGRATSERLDQIAAQEQAGR